MAKKPKIVFQPNDEKIEKYITGLNDDQKNAFFKMRDFLYMVDSRAIFSLKGFAGTGKTYVITRLIQYMKDNQRHFTKYGDLSASLTAPTNKAVQVLRENSIPELKKQVSFRTIHKLLGLKEFITDSGEQVFKASGEDQNDIKFQQIVVVDETSMLADELFFEIKNHSKMVKIILMGDGAQIPPVGKSDCEPYLNPEKHNIIECTLNQIMRQKEGSRIVELSFKIRNDEYNEMEKVDIYDGFDLTVMNTPMARPHIAQFIIDKFSSAEAKENHSFVKIIAWTNKKVAEYNSFARKIFMKSHFNAADEDFIKVMPGDKMITNSPVIEGNKIILTTNQEFEVQKFSIAEDDFACAEHKDNLKFYWTEIKYFDPEIDEFVIDTIRILHEESESIYKKVLERCKQSALHCPPSKKGYFWREYYKFMRQFADVSYSYAVTAHKSQGSTYTETIVDYNNIAMNQNIRERNRIFYTAVTRAKNHLLIIN